MAFSLGNRSGPAVYVRGLPRRLLFLARSTPRLALTVFPIVAWSIVSVSLGLLLGFAAVILPPTGTFGIVAIAGIALLWALPDLPHVPTKVVRASFFIMLVVILTIPSYYTLIVPGLPWISARRLVTFGLIIPFVIAVAGSSQERHNISTIFTGSALLSLFCIGFFIMTIVSTITSRDLSQSSSQMSDIILSWYTPLFAAVLVIRSKEDVLTVMKIICFSSLLISAIALYDYMFMRQFYINFLPAQMLRAIIESSPQMSNLGVMIFRNGLPRSTSVFLSPLALAEFLAMTAPIGYYFVAQGQSARERALGIGVTIMCLVGIYCSGSRGGWNCLIGASVAFVGIWLLRKMRFNRNSLLPAFASVTAAVTFVVLLVLILFWRPLHNMVLGGGAEAASDSGRAVQWALAIPKILQSPIVGYGVNVSTQTVGYTTPGGALTLDSYAISLLVDNGIPGFVFFAGMIVIGIFFGVREYITKPTTQAAMAGSLACSLVAFGIYRLYLSQRENHTLFFILVGLVMWLMSARAHSASEGAPDASPIAKKVGAVGATHAWNAV